jgi:acyl carrier protein
MSENIEDKIKSIIVSQLGVDESAVVPKAKFVEDLGADSLDIVELVMAMEEAFEVDIPDEEAENIRSIEDATSFITKATDVKSSS